MNRDVEEMLNRDGAPTASLKSFVKEYENDDNIWWIVGCGHHMNLFDAAIERIEELEAELKARDAHQ